MLQYSIQAKLLVWDKQAQASPSKPLYILVFGVFPLVSANSSIHVLLIAIQTKDIGMRIVALVYRNSLNLWFLWYNYPMRLHEYAKKMGVTYKTAWLWWKAGKLFGYQLDTGTIIITEGDKLCSVIRTTPSET
jgi:hypothetical protein